MLSNSRAIISKSYATLPNLKTSTQVSKYVETKIEVTNQEEISVNKKML